MFQTELSENRTSLHYVLGRVFGPHRRNITETYRTYSVSYHEEHLISVSEGTDEM